MSRPFLWGLLGAVLILAAGAYLLTREEAAPAVRASVSVAEAMGSLADTAGYARATAPQPFVFPEDHGPHPDFKTEWWYFTGNLATPEGRRFGYQFTLFRSALTPAGSLVEGRASGWATNQLYMGHFTVTDVGAETFRAFERFSRGGAGLAGAEAAPLRVWLEDWETAQAGEAPPGARDAVLRVRAQEEGYGIDLTLRQAKPLVLQGDRGYDRKGPLPGDASFYYSMTRLVADGTVTAGGETFAVEGLSWMDREWSTSALGEEQVGWDWFSLHLDDGRDLMYYQLRRRDGAPSAYSDGVLVGPGGEATPLEPGEVELEVLDRWTSPHSGAVYPSGWRLRIPAEGVDLTLTPVLRDQELNVSVRYWEGAVRVEGTSEGRGYVELTGYDGEAGGRGE